MGHEFIGIVEEVGSEVSGFERGDLVVAPFVWANPVECSTAPSAWMRCPTGTRPWPNGNRSKS